MKLRWILKTVLGLGALLCFIVVGLMFTKLSFIDWPYAIGGIILLTLTLAIPIKRT
jgi:hypothetical protein